MEDLDVVIESLFPVAKKKHKGPINDNKLQFFLYIEQKVMFCSSRPEYFGPNRQSRIKKNDEYNKIHIHFLVKMYTIFCAIYTENQRNSRARAHFL